MKLHALASYKRCMVLISKWPDVSNTVRTTAVRRIDNNNNNNNNNRIEENVMSSTISDAGEHHKDVCLG